MSCSWKMNASIQIIYIYTRKSNGSSTDPWGHHVQFAWYLICVTNRHTLVYVRKIGWEHSVCNYFSYTVMFNFPWNYLMVYFIKNLLKIYKKLLWQDFPYQLCLSLVESCWVMRGWLSDFVWSQSVDRMCNWWIREKSKVYWTLVFQVFCLYSKVRKFVCNFQLLD